MNEKGITRNNQINNQKSVGETEKPENNTKQKQYVNPNILYPHFLP